MPQPLKEVSWGYQRRFRKPKGIRYMILRQTLERESRGEKPYNCLHVGWTELKTLSVPCVNQRTLFCMMPQCQTQRNSFKQVKPIGHLLEPRKNYCVGMLLYSRVQRFTQETTQPPLKINSQPKMKSHNRKLSPVRETQQIQNTNRLSEETF